MFLLIEAVGDSLINLGVIITPVSFLAYLVLTFLQYMWRRPHYTKAVKVVWYLVVGIGEFSGDKRFELFIFLMIFMDCIDSLFEYLEERRDIREANQ